MSVPPWRRASPISACPPTARKCTIPSPPKIISCGAGSRRAPFTFEELQKIRWSRIFDALGIAFDGPTFEHYFRTAIYESAVPVPGAVPLLQSLSRHSILCAASNGPYEQQLHRLELGGMKQYFTHFFISQRIGAAKPAAAFFDTAFRELNEARSTPILPRETLIIGDSLTSDIAGGLQYGMKTCYYRRPGAPAAPAGVDYTVTALSRVPALLKMD